MIGGMESHAPRSEFVQLVMPDATAAEIEAAELRWFEFLQTIDRIAVRLEKEKRDSRESPADASVDHKAP